MEAWEAKDPKATRHLGCHAMVCRGVAVLSTGGASRSINGLHGRGVRGIVVTMCGLAISLAGLSCCVLDCACGAQPGTTRAAQVELLWKTEGIIGMRQHSRRSALLSPLAALNVPVYRLGVTASVGSPTQARDSQSFSTVHGASLP